MPRTPRSDIGEGRWGPPRPPSHNSECQGNRCGAASDLGGVEGGKRRRNLGAGRQHEGQSQESEGLSATIVGDVLPSEAASVEGALRPRMYTRPRNRDNPAGQVHHREADLDVSEVPSLNSISQTARRGNPFIADARALRSANATDHASGPRLPHAAALGATPAGAEAVFQGERRANRCGTSRERDEGAIFAGSEAIFQCERRARRRGSSESVEGGVGKAGV